MQLYTPAELGTSQPDINIQAVDAPFAAAEQASEPLEAYPCPLHPRLGHLVGCGCHDGAGRGVDHVGQNRSGCRVDISARRLTEVPRSPKGDVASGCARLEPVAAKVEKAVLRPVARGQEEYDEQERAVEAWSVEEVRADEEEEDERR